MPCQPNRSHRRGPYAYVQAGSGRWPLVTHGFAVGEKNPIGKSRAVRNPAGASKITGMEFTATEAVAISPWDPPGIVKLMLGCPVSVTVSAGSFAPTYICSSM